MKVLYDITTLGAIHVAPNVRGAGIYRATEALALSLQQRTDLDVAWCANPSQATKALRYLDETKVLEFDRFLVPSMSDDQIETASSSGLRPSESTPDMQSYFQTSYSPERIYNAGKFDIYHANWRSRTELPSHGYPSIVLPVFDVIALKNPEWFVSPGEANPIGDYLTTLLNSINRTHTLIVNNQVTKNDVVERFSNISAEQIHVVPLGVSDDFGPRSKEEIARVRSRYGIPSGHRYVLCLNTLEPRKNMKAAVDAYRELVAGGGFDDLTLVLAGSKGWLADELVDDVRTAQGSILVTGAIEEEDLGGLYAGASAFCYPSLDEGFGFPVLEAMKSGVPVVTSDRPALVEVSGGAALTASPNDPTELATALRRVLADEETAARLRALGLEHAAAFTWDRTADLMSDVYRQAVSSRPRIGVSGLGAAAPRISAVAIEEGADLEGLRDRFTGQPVFVVADHEPPPPWVFADEVTFAVNGAIHGDARGTWKPTFGVVAQRALGEDKVKLVNGVAGTRCFLERPASGEPQLRTGAGIIDFEMAGSTVVVGDTPEFSAPISPTDTSLAAALQIAYHLGFDPIYLVGTATDPGWGPEAHDAVDPDDWHREFSARARRDGRRVFNTSPATLPNVYPRCHLREVLGHGEIVEYSREQHAHVDETEVVAHMFKQQRPNHRTMVDVGAHRGTSAVFFVDDDWQIHCFEPDPENRSHLVSKFGDRPNLTIDTRAVGDRPAEGVPFFVSEESGGISGLSQFRESHRQGGTVDITTIAQVATDRHIETIDFLKIDVEGFDFSVLKGVPWDSIQPEVIECEYEDFKTVPLGHTVHDVAHFLQDRGYAVYVSEWHPIIAYGVRHDWRRVVPYGAFDIPSDSWGNLLAFRKDPGPQAISAAFAALTTTDPGAAATPPRVPASKRAVSPANNRRPAPTGKRRFYANSADRLRDRNPRLYNTLRSGRRSAPRVLRRYGKWLAALALVVVAIGLVGAFAPSAAARYAIWTIGGWLVTLGLVTVLALYALSVSRRGGASRKLINNLGKDLAAYKQTVKRQASERDGAVDRQFGAVQLSMSDIEGTVAQTNQRLASLEGALEGALTSLQTTLANISGAQNELVGRANTASESMTVLHDKISEVTQRESAANQRIATLESQSAGLRSSPYTNAIGLRTFQRNLPQDDIEHIQQYWLPLLGVDLSGRAIRYLAHKTAVTEDRCEGRLATTVQTAVLRSLALLSLGGKSLEVLEIGTLNGIGGGLLYQTGVRSGRDVHLTLIDPLDGYYGQSEIDGQTGVAIDRNILDRNLAAMGVAIDDYRVIQMLSTDPDAVRAASDRLYDLLLIDGDHSLAGVAADFDLYSSLVRPGGLLLFDDYDTEAWPAIKPYVDEVAAKHADEWLWIGGEWRTGILQRRRVAERPDSIDGPA